jgi:DNA-binding transcriptional regulator GbsR (MarR family)
MSAFEQVREDFVQLWGAMGPFWGISPTTARVYSWLLARAEPADTEEIMEGLDLSRGAVSMACRELRDWHLVVSEKAPGSRRHVFHPATDLEKVMRNIVLIRKRREWDPVLESLEEWLPQLEEDPSPDAQVFRQRLASLRALVALMDSMIEVFLKGGMVGKVGLKLLIRAAEESRGSRKKKSSTHKDGDRPFKVAELLEESR